MWFDRTLVSRDGHWRVRSTKTPVGWLIIQNNAENVPQCVEKSHGFRLPAVAFWNGLCLLFVTHSTTSKRRTRVFPKTLILA